MSELLNKIIKSTPVEEENIPITINNTQDLLGIANITNAELTGPGLPIKDRIKNELYQDAFEDFAFYYSQQIIKQQKGTCSKEFDEIKKQLDLRIDFFHSISERIIPFLIKKKDSNETDEKTAAEYLISILKTDLFDVAPVYSEKKTDYANKNNKKMKDE